MSRTIELKDGKTLRKFYISRMGAYQAESWLIRAALVCGRDPGDLGKIFTGDKVSLVQALLRINYTEAQPLLDELLACVKLVNGEGMLQLGPDTAGVIESPITLMRLRIEALKENFSFFIDGSAFGSLTELVSDQSAQKSVD